MIGVEKCGERRFGIGVRLRETIEPRHYRRHRQVRKIHRGAMSPQPEPVLIGHDGVDRWAEVTEAVEEAVADAAPVAKLDADLEGAHRAAHEIGFVDSEARWLNR